MNRTAPFITTVYALLVLMLGIMGYRQAGSVISLVMGVSLGILLLVSVIFMLKGQKWAYGVGLLLSILLLIVFGFRFGATKDFMPAAMSLLSGIVVVTLLVQTGKIAKR